MSKATLNCKWIQWSRRHTVLWKPLTHRLVFIPCPLTASHRLLKQPNTMSCHLSPRCSLSINCTLFCSAGSPILEMTLISGEVPSPLTGTPGCHRTARCSAHLFRLSRSEREDECVIHYAETFSRVPQSATLHCLKAAALFATVYILLYRAANFSNNLVGCETHGDTVRVGSSAYIILLQSNASRYFLFPVLSQWI